MFKAITFAHQYRYDPRLPPLDLGHLVEGMLFYQRVIVDADPICLRQLVEWFGPTELMLLLEEKILEVSYSETMLGIASQSVGAFQVHDTVEMSSRSYRLDELARKICIDVVGKEGKGRRLARGLESLIDSRPLDATINRRAQDAMLNQRLVSGAAKGIIRSLVPGANVEGIEFETEKVRDGIRVHTNIDFDQINQLYHRSVPASHSSITEAMLLSNLQQIEREMFVSVREDSELATSDLSSALISARIEDIISRSRQSAETIQAFERFAFDESRALREAINSNQVDRRELVELLISAKKFKEWLAGVDPDRGLIAEYYRAVTRATFLDRLPGKTARWSLMTAGGLMLDALGGNGVGTAAAVLLSAFDGYYLDGMIRGWRPNQFVEEDLKLFLSGPRSSS